MEHQHNYAFLPEQSQEDALHPKRLLAVEERAFQRVQRNLLGPSSLLRQLPIHLPSPPPESSTTTTNTDSDVLSPKEKLENFRTDVLLDFAALESSLLRIQLLHTSNQRERERYAAEKAKILETAQTVRENTVELRGHLVEAQRVLELRKGYDGLAGGILDDKRVKGREETGEECRGLEKEIEELQVESGEYEATWRGRREGFERIVGEGGAMRRLIKGVRDEPEGEEDQNMVEGSDDVTRGEGSRLGTPMLEGRTPLRVDDGSQTPMHVSLLETGSGTPARPVNRFLEVEGAAGGMGSAAGSPLLQAVDPTADVEMAETLEVPQSVKGERGLEAGGTQVLESGEEEAEGMDEGL
ncbi:hypothetical protein LTR56_016547 [Elasticomyces elasticus]|nr:hypothetical protein LTR22_025325 [Elasticomyces elasticus]KAK3632061.1 hypothetical protein LTR56_016547 [Elasticomyces elasticus]KAK4931839.1 hypothetical protein LTR49_001907 [Elasticomyces elasticus]KAK5754689.1 hypothetical protein LTS12_015191 [Elasticomyces elasticus]